MNPGELRLRLHREVLGELAGTRPRNLVSSMRYQVEDMPEAAPFATEEDFRDALLFVSDNLALVEMWRTQLYQWDFDPAPTWSDAEPRTPERRAHICLRLGVDLATAKLLEANAPIPALPKPVVIGTRFEPWYHTRATRFSRHGREGYWNNYRLLLAGKQWSPEAVADLDAATDAVVERLADPTAPTAYQSKGLVVGYVQSGKTANFTGVVAKAVDAGYRLVIVLSGTLNLLRAQTQRRLDMELVGRENILRGAAEHESDYHDDPAWIGRRFQSFGDLPSVQGWFDIHRLTTRDNDYRSLQQGIYALEFEKREPALPLYDPVNLHRAAARLMVVKKNKTVLTRLVKDLNKIKTPLAEIPVLIIDDESDEASVNTTRPKPDTERTAINQSIADLLTMLPRAQYLGYTATPYANVFIDPSDTTDIFPKDFLLSLERPAGYMGATDFHDIDSAAPESERTYANSNEKAHVRDVVVADEDDTEALIRAVDMFVLAAAMKVYREAHGLGDGYFTHHTMLIHESSFVADHRELLGRVTEVWWNADYSGPTGHARLRELFDTDVALVSAARADGYAVPPDFDTLRPYISPAVIRIGGDQSPIIVVNGDKVLETGEADFDKRPIWKILIGGQKLSRGFTVEGLTVSYFRRRAGNMSALMQMGRWFGFRRGYRDLVRLYIGREEAGPGRKTFDLYQMFEAICQDEDAFRQELRQYATMVDGEPQVTPAQVPPLVSQHLPLLPPTSKNKMYNARLVEVRSPGRWREPTAYPTIAADLRHNVTAWLPILDELSTAPADFAYHFPDGTASHAMTAHHAIVGADRILEVLESVRWRAERQFAPDLEYLRSITADGAVLDWAVLCPQPNRNAAALPLGHHTLPRWDRGRRRDPLFGAISYNWHRTIARRIADALPDSGDPHTESFRSARRGALLLHPVVEPVHLADIAPDGSIDPGKLVVTFGFVAPSTAVGRDSRVVRFETTDSSTESAIVEADQEA
ncbi:Z1 domain-containing protein [Nocardia sp. NPDC056064]|uniref:Z1 domain-containing protein n=1 Tax=Nocardia sp. NPDC056064 TaxID=3345701 RepID=UPI0035E2A611